MDRPVALTTVLDTGTIRAIVNASVADAAPEPVRGTVRSAELALMARTDADRVHLARRPDRLAWGQVEGTITPPTEPGSCFNGCRYSDARLTPVLDHSIQR